MRALPTALLLLILTATHAMAGAWPREKGSTFISMATRLTWPQDITTWTSYNPTEDYQTLYLEHGLSDRLTIGFDLGRSVSGQGKTVAFLQYALRDADTGPKIAAQLGFGRISGDPSVRPGLLLGWGLPGGWLSIDTVAEFHANTRQTDLKMDITWGRNLSKDRKLLLQLQTGLQENDPAFARFAPSMVIPVNKRLKAELGATYGLAGDSSMGLKLGLWTEF